MSHSLVESSLAGDSMCNRTYERCARSILREGQHLGDEDRSNFPQVSQHLASPQPPYQFRSLEGKHAGSEGVAEVASGIANSDLGTSQGIGSVIGTVPESDSGNVIVDEQARHPARSHPRWYYMQQSSSVALHHPRFGQDKLHWIAEQMLRLCQPWVLFGIRWTRGHREAYAWRRDTMRMLMLMLNAGGLMDEKRTGTCGPAGARTSCSISIDFRLLYDGSNSSTCSRFKGLGRSQELRAETTKGMFLWDALGNYRGRGGRWNPFAVAKDQGSFC